MVLKGRYMHSDIRRVLRLEDWRSRDTFCMMFFPALSSIEEQGASKGHPSIFVA